MICSQCNFMMGPFDKTCPRCTHLAGTPSAVSTQSVKAINMLLCPACQQSVSGQAISCPRCGQPISREQNHPSLASTSGTTGNGSGTGATAIVPGEIKGFNWGAFLLGWIWAIGHNTWIGLLCFIPTVGIIMFVILGIKGNEWAWQNRRWESIEHFKQVEAIWTKSGIITFCVFSAMSFVYLIIFLATLPGFQAR